MKAGTDKRHGEAEKASGTLEQEGFDECSQVVCK